MLARVMMLGAMVSATATASDCDYGCDFGCDACAGETTGCDSGLGLSGFGDCFNACDPCGGSLWTVTADAIFMTRSDPDSRLLAFNTAAPSENLNASDFDFKSETGVDVSLRRSIGTRGAVELRYFGIDDWDAGVNVTTTPGQLLEFSSNPPQNVTSADGIAATYSSELHNAEINVIRQYRNWLDLMIGFRHVEMDESGTAALVNSPIDYEYRVSTRNRLYGAQMGADVNLICNETFTVDMISKVGIYGNASKHSGAASTIAGTDPVFGRDDRTSFVGELAFIGGAEVTDCITVRAGYRLLWLDGLALGSEQLAASDFNTGTGIDSGGDVFYHGSFVGVELAL